MARLELKNISKSFGRDVVAVRDISLSVKEGEFLTLLGPSGCGKTTLLRLIAGLEEPDSGKILIDGADVTDKTPSRRDVAMVFQNYALYPHMRVFNNIAVSLRLKGVSKEETRSRVTRVAETLDIAQLLTRLPKELSGGQRQRVALARALVREPRLFLLDEPLSNLDAVLREKTRAELKLLFSRIGGTVVYVTHDQVEAMSMSSRVVVIEGGRVQQEGKPEEIYNMPASKFVASFVGSPSISFVNARIENGRLSFGGFSTALHDGERLKPREVIAGIRPEDVEVAPDASSGKAPQAKVLLIEQFGSYAVATLDHSGETLRALVSPGSIEAGALISFSVEEDRIHLFDPDSGKTLR